LAAIATGFGVMVTFFNAISQEWLGLFTAVIAVAFPAIMALWYSFQGYRSYGSEA
jgi:predicted outer membrane lipoprotein